MKEKTRVLYGKPAPINYIPLNFAERWCIVKIIGGKYAGEECCLACTFKDKSIVELSLENQEDSILEIIENKHLNFNLEEHLETNRLLDTMNQS